MKTPFPREALAAAGHRFEQTNRQRIQLADFDEILRHHLTGADPDELAQAICDSVVSDAADPAYRQSAYLVLGKKSDSDLLRFFRERLRIELGNEESDACYQIMLALEILDEEIFSPGRDDDARANQRGLNQEDAAAYLERLS